MKRRLLVAVVLAVFSSSAAASETKWWVLDTAADLLKGRGEGVAVTQEGMLKPVARWSRRVSLDEPIAAAVVEIGENELVVGTGFPARLYHVTPSGKQLLAEFEEEQVTALLQSSAGELFAATVAPASLYRIRDGEGEVVGQLGEGGMWDLAVFDGQIIIATGPPASLFRLTDRGLERWIELPDAHARCLTVADDVLLVGTSGKGLIFGVRTDGSVSLVADSPFTEISALVTPDDGTVWATALVGEPPRSAPAKQGEGEVTVEASAAPQDLELPKVNGATASSELIRLTPEGALIRVHRFTGQVASALASDGDGVLVGTGFEGEIWRFIEDGGARLATIDAVQATAFAESGNAAVVQGPAGVLWPAAGPDVDSGFRAPSLRLARPARFGEYRVLPDDETVRIRFRSGASDKPDENWLGWSDWLPAHGSVPKPPAKSLQWEVRSVANGGKFLSVDRVEVSYREVNVGPRIVSVEVESPGVVYLGSPPPSGPVIDASNPDFSGIFSVLQPDGGGGASKPRQGKKYWRVGYRTVVWKAEDDNGDPLSHEVEVEAKDGFRLSVRKRLTTTQLGVDTTALPDGLYRFRITASDKPNNPEAPFDTTAVGRWFTVDNTPPEIRATRQEEIWQIEISDAASPIKRVEWSRDGAPWEVLEPVDGMLDGATEQFSFPVSEGHHLVVVRAIDRHHNRTVEGIVEGP